MSQINYRVGHDLIAKYSTHDSTDRLNYLKLQQELRSKQSLFKRILMKLRPEKVQIYDGLL